MTLRKFVVIFLCTIVFALRVFEYILVENIYFTDATYNAYEQQITAVEHENALLHEQILRNSSLTIITQKAKKRGFVPGPFVYLK